eukprot:Sspe_Gene.38765::Locus_18699_Transcript_1_1_Confidence_1.000_Length_2449::g.38765::m.38765
MDLPDDLPARCACDDGSTYVLRQQGTRYYYVNQLTGDDEEGDPGNIWIVAPNRTGEGPKYYYVNAESKETTWTLPGLAEGTVGTQSSHSSTENVRQVEAVDGRLLLALQSYAEYREVSLDGLPLNTHEDVEAVFREHDPDMYPFLLKVYLYYARVAPEKLCDVPRVCAEWKGKEAELWDALARRYGVQGGAVQGDRPDYAALLRAFYHATNPDKIKDIPTILLHYKGREEALLAALADRYPEHGDLLKEVPPHPVSPKSPEHPSEAPPSPSPSQPVGTHADVAGEGKDEVGENDLEKESVCTEAASAGKGAGCADCPQHRSAIAALEDTVTAVRAENDVLREKLEHSQTAMHEARERVAELELELVKAKAAGGARGAPSWFRQDDKDESHIDSREQAQVIGQQRQELKRLREQLAEVQHSRSRLAKSREEGLQEAKEWKRALAVSREREADLLHTVLTMQKEAANNDAKWAKRVQMLERKLEGMRQAADSEVKRGADGLWDLQLAMLTSKAKGPQVRQAASESLGMPTPTIGHTAPTAADSLPAPTPILRAATPAVSQSASTVTMFDFGGIEVCAAEPLTPDLPALSVPAQRSVATSPITELSSPQHFSTLAPEPEHPQLHLIIAPSEDKGCDAMPVIPEVAMACDSLTRAAGMRRDLERELLLMCRALHGQQLEMASLRDQLKRHELSARIPAAAVAGALCVCCYGVRNWVKREVLSVRAQTKAIEELGRLHLLAKRVDGKNRGDHLAASNNPENWQKIGLSLIKGTRR